MIIDSKVPLASYERLIAATDEVERGICADEFVKDMKRHIDDLAGKRYQENEKLQAHDCALMFIPIEGALAAALTREPELFVYAWDRHVVLVGPPTLLMTMRTVGSIWRYELQGQNAQEIARLAGDLCDKVTMSLLDLNGVAEKLTGAFERSQRGGETALDWERQCALHRRTHSEFGGQNQTTNAVDGR